MNIYQRLIVIFLTIFGVGTWNFSFVPPLYAESPKKTSHKNVKKTSHNNVKKTSEDQDDESSAGIVEPDIITSDYKMSILPSTSAKQVILQDFESGAILFEKNADVLMSPSSMTKMATAAFVMDKIKSGALLPDSQFCVSKNAYRKEGSTMYLKLGQKVSVEDLLAGLIILSGNDAAIVLAEGLCGKEDIFASELTSFVRSFGALNTNFVNANGLPDEMHKTTARDLLLIARHVITDYPYELYSQQEFTFNGVHQTNRNLLLRKNIGCDGIKTGKTIDGGFGIAASCVQDGRRLILIANGYESEQDRLTDTSALINWGTKMFVNKTLYPENKLIIQIPVWYGEESYLPVTVDNPVTVTLPRSAQKDLKVVLCYDTPISAPVKKGDKIGEIQITSSTLQHTLTIPLIASISIREAGFFKKVKDSFLYLIWGIRKPEMQ